MEVQYQCPVCKEWDTKTKTVVTEQIPKKTQDGGVIMIGQSVTPLICKNSGCDQEGQEVKYLAEQIHSRWVK